MTYSIKVKKGFNTKNYKNVKGHYWANDVPGNPFVIIFENEVQLMLNKYESIEFSKELFIIKARKAEEESNGVAKVVKNA